MAKNLKLNVKNAQLAEALKLGKVKKPSVKKKKAEEPEVSKDVVEHTLESPSAAAPEKVEAAAPPPFVPEEKKPAPAPEREKTPPPAAREEMHEPPQRSAPPPPHPQQRQPYQQQQHSGGYQPHYRKPHYQPPQHGSGQQPHYQKREPYYPPSGPGPQPRSDGYPAQRSTGSYPAPQREGYTPRTGGYPPRTGGGYPPRTGGYPPRTGGYPSSRPPGVRPDPNKRPLPPKESTRQEIPPHKKTVKAGEGDGETRKIGSKDFREQKPTKKLPQIERTFDARDRQGLRDDLEEQTWRKRRPTQKMRPVQQEEIIRPKNLKVRIPIMVKDLAQEMKLKASQLIAKLFMKGVVLTLNDYLDDETTIQLLGHDFDCEITIDTTEEDRLKITDKSIKQEISETPPDELILRPPVAAFMGHVDHGKTSLIDAIRKSNVVAGEAGAITQHIGAFKCHTDAGPITILDTPGHEAFSAMRARGADVTDIVVLVIAGDEGMRTQTIEALQQAQAANCPILIAINKSDKPNFNAENVYRQLADQNLLPEVWGGQTITVNCSAVTGQGIKELLEMLALQAEILELKANPHTRARGTVIESEMHKGLGAVATVLVQNGTLRLGDAIVFAQHFARIKTMHDEHNRELAEAGPSTPIKITGLSGLPEAGSEFIVVKNEKEAMEIAEKRSEGKRHALQQVKRTGLESFMQEKATGIQKKILNLILRADVQGSVEALKTSLLKIQTNKVDLNIISAAVGEVSESDVQLAAASKATIIGFHTQIESHAESLIKELKVTVKLHDIIYHAVDDVRKLMLNLLDKIAQETDIGAAEVRMIFKASQLGIIAGCMVTDGIIKRSSHVRLMRDGQRIWKGPIHSLKRVKEDVREVSKGYECGIVLQNFSDVKAGDILQAYEITYLEQEL